MFAINWSLWAIYIHSQEAYCHGSLLRQAIPSSLIHLFRMAAEDPGVAQQRTITANQGAIGKNNRVLGCLTAFKEETSELSRCMHEMTTELTRRMDGLLARLDASLRDANIQGEILGDFQSSLRGRETGFSGALFRGVRNQEDLDHVA